MRLRFIGATDAVRGIVNGNIYDLQTVPPDPAQHLLGTGRVQIGLRGALPYTPLGLVKNWEPVELAELREWKADVEAAHRATISETCEETDDRKHCTCVPALRRELAALRAKLEDAEKPRSFPVIAERGAAAHPIRIPWSVAEKAYSVYAAKYGRMQTLERLAERGGFAPSELDDLFPEWRKEAGEIESLTRQLEEAKSSGELLDHMIKEQAESPGSSGILIRSTMAEIASLTRQLEEARRRERFARRCFLLHYEQVRYILRNSDLRHEIMLTLIEQSILQQARAEREEQARAGEVS